MLTSDWSDADFRHLCKTAEICSAPGAPCDPRDVLKVMNVESGARADAKNAHSSATGLIQWMADPNGLYFGRTRDAFIALGVTGQLEFVRDWFTPKRGMLTSASRVYVDVFLPAFVKESSDPNFVLASEDSPHANLRSAYVWNKYFDNLGNRDGKIQVWELDNAISHELLAGGVRVTELFGRLATAMGRPVDNGAIMSLMDVQTALGSLGFDAGPRDGVWGPKSTAAAKAYQASRGLPVDGIVGPATMARLRADLAAQSA